MTPAEKDHNHFLAGQLLDARLARGLSLKQVGEALGISYQAVQKCENGHTMIPAARLAVLAEFLGLGIDYFFRKDNSRRRDAQAARYKRVLLMRKLQKIERRDPEKFRAICDLIGPVINSPDM